MMPIFAVYLTGFVNFFSRFGRYADLILGSVVLALGFYWGSTITMGFGALSIFAFAVDLNGFIQRSTTTYAKKRFLSRAAAKPNRAPAVQRAKE